MLNQIQQEFDTISVAISTARQEVENLRTQPGA